MHDPLLELEKKIELHKKKKRERFLRIGGGAAVAGLLLLFAIWVIAGSLRQPAAPASSSESTSALKASPEASDGTAGFALDGNVKAQGATAQITVSLMGDCTLGTDESFNRNTSLNAYYEYQGADYFFRNVKSILEQDDLSIINMEGTLTDSDQRADKLYAFKGEPEYVDILTEGSIEAANLANNHSHDYGEQSFTDTKETLQDAGITTFGYDETAVLEIKGIKVGLIGIYELADHLERRQQLLDNLEQVKAKGAQIIIVVFHWGNEKETSPDSNQTTLGRLAIDHGADLVVGHHSHVLQPIEEYNGKYIAYSLGNFCFGGNSNPSDKDTVIFQQTFTVKDGILQETKDVHIIPCRISSDASFNNYQPTPVDGEDAQRIYGKLNFPATSY